MDSQLQELLATNGLEAYTELLEQKGFHNASQMASLSEDDLNNLMSSKEDIDKMTEALKESKKSAKIIETRYVYETQRWFPLMGWNAKRLPTDITEWVGDWKNRKPQTRDQISLPEGCVWISDWEAEADATGEEGWEYAGDWWMNFHPKKKSATDCVRRRRWNRRYTYSDEEIIGVTGMLTISDPQPLSKTGLTFLESDPTLLHEVEQNSIAEMSGGSCYVGRRILKINDKDFSSYDPLTPVTTVTFAQEENIEDKGIHKLFGLHPCERLINDYQCSYVKRFPHHGRLYITHNKLCFYSIMCDPVVLDFSSFRSATKKKVLLMECIIIKYVTASGDEEQHKFTAFLGDSAEILQLLNQLITIKKTSLDNGILSEEEADHSSVGTESLPQSMNNSISVISDDKIGSPSDPEFGRPPVTKSAAAIAAADILSKQESKKITQLDENIISKPETPRSSSKKQTPPRERPTDSPVPARSPINACSPIPAPNTPVRSSQVDKMSDLRREFADCPENATLVESYQCSYKAKNKIDRLGRMSLTDSHVFFVSPLLQQSIQLDMMEILEITKKKDLMFLNAIVITTVSDVYTFTAFIQRDAAFSLISKLWNVKLSLQGKTVADVRNEHEEREAKKQQKQLQRQSLKEPIAAKEVSFTETDLDDMHQLFSECTINDKFLPASTVLSKGKKLLSVSVPGSLNSVFSALFSEPSFLVEYHKKRGEYGGTKENPQPVSIPNWDSFGPGCGSRKFDCLTVIQAPWSKHTKYVEYQRYAMTQSQLYIHFCSQTPEVMYGENFRIEVVLSVTENKSTSQCDVDVIAHINFLKSFMMKSAVDSTATTELNAAYKVFCALAKQYCSRLGNSSSSVEETEEISIPEPVVEQSPTSSSHIDVVVESLPIVFFVILLYCWYLLWSLSSASVTAITSITELSTHISSVVKSDSSSCDAVIAALDKFSGISDPAQQLSVVTSIAQGQANLISSLFWCTLVGFAVSLQCVILWQRKFGTG